MIKFGLILLAILFIVLLFIGAILGKIIRFFMPKNTTQNRTRQQSSNDVHEPEKEQKVFSDDVGEYVQYEEVKEE